MLRRFLTAAALGALTTLTALGGAFPAYGDDPTCTKIDPRTGECIIRVPGPSDPGDPGDDPSDPGGDPSEPGGDGKCYDDISGTPQEVPCSVEGIYSPTAYWSAARNCYVGRVEPQPEPGYYAWEGHTDGAIYYCFTLPITSTGIFEFWAAQPPVAALPPSPEELARQAIAMMGLKAIDIGIVPEPNPNSMGFVGLPTWMWTLPTPETWGPIVRSASGGGVTVTATAHVKTVAWSMGDGTTVSCGSPGTPYQDAFGKRDSPTCGHTYTRTSVGKPSDAYPVAATSYWAIDWAGGGESGTITVDFVAETQVRIGELQVLVTG